MSGRCAHRFAAEVLSLGMPETQNDKKIYRLEEISASLERMITQFYGDKFFWIRAEISEFRMAPSGHAYLNLVDANEEVIRAEMRGMIWKTALDGVRKELGNEFDALMKPGSGIVFKAGIQFSKRFGLSLTILNIDLGAVLGEIEKRKQETILRLRRDGHFETNKQHSLPLVTQRIALIGAPDSAGLQDFVKQLERNDWGFDFAVEVIPVTVQGDKAQPEIINALEKLNAHRYECVAILRGGGSKIDLDVFNQEPLALAIARCSLPVITGIGHETDISVADLVAHTYLKTPTASAYFFIDRAVNFLGRLQQFKKELSSAVQDIRHRAASELQEATSTLLTKPTAALRWRIMQMSTDAQHLGRLVQQRAASAREGLKRTRQLIAGESDRMLHIDAPRELTQLSDQLLHWAPLKVRRSRDGLDNLYFRLKAVAPDQVLQYGYSMTRVNGDWLKRGMAVQVGDEMTTETIDKFITSKITKIDERRTEL